MKPTIAVDLAKSVFEVAVSQRPGRVEQRRRLSRRRFLPFFAQQPPATVLLEACSSAHFWARQLRDLGHEAVLLPPRHVRPYRQGNKTDRADAKALLEAHRNEDIRPVPVKSVEQHALTALHRLRSGWMATRTARINAVRGILRRFPSGRHFASFLGLTPKEHSSGHVRRLGRISMRGDAYLRTLLIHGARSVLWAAKSKKEPDRLRLWALELEQSRGHNKAAVALANKLARFAWVVLNEQRDFQTTRRAA